MDPNANLQEQRKLTEHILRLWDQAADDGTFTTAQRGALTHNALRLAELAEALDSWIYNGGFLPRRWVPRS